MAIRYRKCPKCNSKNIIDIVYGYPPYDLFLLQEEGKIMLGGCCISDDDPNYYCKDCHNRYKSIDVIERQLLDTEVPSLVIATPLQFL